MGPAGSARSALTGLAAAGPGFRGEPAWLLKAAREPPGFCYETGMCVGRSAPVRAVRSLVVS